VSIEGEPAAPAHLRATLSLAGEWADSASALDNLERAWKELRDSPTGKLFGLDRARDFEARGDLQVLTLSAIFEVGPLARGLRDATSADVWEILELEGVSPGTPP
jgi:hypothetical protein